MPMARYPAGDVRSIQAPNPCANEVATTRMIGKCPTKKNLLPIAGRVETVAFEVVPFARIELMDDGRVLATATTDSNGKFMFPGTYAPSREYRIRLVSDRYAAAMHLHGLQTGRSSDLEVLARRK